jgi:methyl-accepting chemotaxis protein
VSITSINSINHTSRQVDHTHKVLGQSASIVSSAVDMETGMRGYLLAGKEGFLTPYNNGEKETYSRIKTLQSTVSDNDKQVKRLTEVGTILRAWQEKVTEPTIALRRQIGDAKTMNDMAKLVGEARGKKYFDGLRAQTALFIDREQKLLDKRRVDFLDAKKGLKENIKLQDETIHWVNHTTKVIADANELLAHAVDMETGMRGFLLAGEDEFLEPYHAGKKEFYALLADLKKTVSDNPVQIKRLASIEEEISAWNSKVSEPAIIKRRQVTSGTGTLDEIRAMVARKDGKKYFDAFRGLIDAFIVMEAKLMQERQALADKASKEMEIQLAKVEKNEEWVVHTYEVIAVANAMLASAVDMETGMRGYLLAGKDAFLDPYKRGDKQFFTQIAQQKKTVSDNPAQVELLTKMEKNVQDWKSDVTEPTIALRRQIGDAKTMDDMARLIGEARGKQYIDKFREIMSQFNAEEEGLMTIRREAAESTLSNTYMLVGLTITVALLAGIALGWYVIASVMRQLGCEPNEIAQVARRVAAGELRTALEGLEGKAKVGAYGSIVNMVSDLRSIFGQITEKGVQLAQTSHDLDRIAKDLASGAEISQNNASAATQEMSRSNQDLRSVAATASQLQSQMANVSTSMGHMNNNLGAISAAAEEASANLNTVASAAEQASVSMVQVNDAVERSNNNISTVAFAVEQISASIGEIRKKCEVAKDQADQANQEGNSSSDHMRNLKQAANEIGKVVGIINDIADQTNMLALNASIESAGAGEAGKGFAVVANEVKDLARQTGEATKMIASQIDDMFQRTENVENAIKVVTKITEEINQANEEILHSVDEQRNSAEEIAHSMSAAKAETDEVTRLVDESTNGITEVSRNVGELSFGIGEVTQSVSRIAASVGEVVQDVDSAAEGTRDVFIRISQASEAANKISDMLNEINEKATNVRSLSGNVNEKAGEMSNVSNELEEMLGKFHL